MHETKQEIGESITDWFTRVKTLAINCEFGDHLDLSLEDKFICGLIKGPILDKVFELKIVDTLSQCYEVALQRKLTVKHKQSIIQEIKALRKISKSNRGHYKNDYKKPAGPNSVDGKRVRFACGKVDHNFSTCKYKKIICSVCNRDGHLPRMCSLHKQKKKKNSTTTSSMKINVRSAKRKRIGRH